MVETKDYCSNCNNIINISIQQTVINRCLRWSISSQCPFCNSMIESDDIGFPPDDIRRIILAEEGEYQLLIKQSELNKVKAVKVLRDALEISITKASTILKLFPKPIVDGTKIEMFYLQKLLECEGIRAEVCRL
ncbi:MAG: hypothetical protein KI793_00345 [Rivularia sp. (in: Bacteria)]|nr:hypothetical protein [Rivularia sp. MS3]